MEKKPDTKSFGDYGVEMCEKYKGKITIQPKVDVKNNFDLAVAYTPGVAEPCLRIKKNKDDVFKYTNRGNTIIVLTDGSRVLGLGDIGPEAGLPVMEGKSVLFKIFADVDAFPICIGSTKADDIVRTAQLLAPCIGGINLEDIKTPVCFEVERRLQDLGIPVMHDDQHGTAMAAVGGLINALKLAGKEWSKIRVVFTGAGAAGSAIAKLILAKGTKEVIITDTAGAVYEGRKVNMNFEKEELAKITNPKKETGKLEEIIKGADVYIGVSGAGIFKKEYIKLMAEKPIIFALSNPVPEIDPKEAMEGGAFLVATGRSDFPNQINNCIAFPGVFRGALDVRAKVINQEMKLAASDALANAIPSPTADNFVPSPFLPKLALRVADAVAKAAIATKVNQCELAKPYEF